MSKTRDEKNSSYSNVNMNKNKLNLELISNVIPKLNLNKIKLLKPKINVSNGANGGTGAKLNLMKINLNLLNNIDNKNLPQISHNNSKNPIQIENSNFKCENILNHPKLKNFKKLKKETDKNSFLNTNVHVHKLNETIINRTPPHANASDHNYEIINESENVIREKDLLYSTNVSCLNVNFYNQNITHNKKISNIKTDANSNVNMNKYHPTEEYFISNNDLILNIERRNGDTNIESNKDDTKKFSEMNMNSIHDSNSNSDSQFSIEKTKMSKNKKNPKLVKKLKSLKQTIQNDKDNHNIQNIHFKQTGTHSPADKTKPLSVINKPNQKSRNHIQHNKSSLLKNTKTLLDTSQNLSTNLEMLVNKLRHNKSMSHKKEEKVEILKNMVEGLTKLTTIMLEDTESESGEFIEKASDMNKKKRKSDYYSNDNNNLLISSTTGKVIKQKANGKIFDLHKNNNYSKNTIDYDQTIIKDDNLQMQYCQYKPKIKEFNQSYSIDCNRNNCRNNNSLIRLLDNKQEEFVKNSRENIKNLMENRYSNSSNSNSLRMMQQNKTVTPHE
jgi:hypothetical protein